MSDILENFQWKISDYGLETNNDEFDYSVSAKDLFATFEYEGGQYFLALMRLLGREWVIRDDILEIYGNALKFHAPKLSIAIDAKILADSLAFYRENDTWIKSRPIKSFIFENFPI